MRDLFYTPDTVEAERRRRIKLSVAAYAYEIKNESIMSDTDFDKECLKVDPTIDTGNAQLDEFFRTKFDPSTGQWIHHHPHPQRIAELYQNYHLRSGSV